MNQSTVQLPGKFQSFKKDITDVTLPEKFTFPFYYDPHPLALLAAEELQDYIQTQGEWEHNFGLDPKKPGLPLGKMFGVLIVQKKTGEIGYLAAVSGKLAETNNHSKFVPPVYDMLKHDSFFIKKEVDLNRLNCEIESLENDASYLKLQAHLKEEYALFNQDLSEKIAAAKQGKLERSERRKKGLKALSEKEFQSLQKALSEESLASKQFINNVKRHWKHRLDEIKDKLSIYKDQITALKEKRKQQSASLQNELFAQYNFLNQYGETANLSEIFTDQKPPAGAGECAAPKLLLYAFKNQLKPMAMAEFWWGISPNTEIRKHRQFYPACQGKCKPILNHMLTGIEMDTNPMLSNPAIGKEIEIIYEDDVLLVINKPHEFLSVPGIHIQDSVYTRMKQRFPKATGPLIVHRLDMSTSGIMLLAKTKKANKHLQHQFIERTIKKRYTALLDGTLTDSEGEINLPIRVDLNDRPRQLVCYKHGKQAETRWKKIEEKKGKTRVYFYPCTGRTHQLRVHAAHSLGLHAPILGDDLYGTKADRLHLHADFIEFVHPETAENMQFFVPANF